MNKDPLEKVIEKKVCDHAKELGCLVYKFTSPARRSVPDRLFIMPGGKGSFFIEFKRKGCKPTEAQKIEIAKILAQGTRVFVIDDVTAGRACVADMLHGVALPTYAKENWNYQRDKVTTVRNSKGDIGAFARLAAEIMHPTLTMDDPAFN